MTNAQQTWTQEFRLQSDDPASAWKWTVGAFWSLAKETSIEELHDPQVNQFLTALYGEDSAAIFGPFYSCNGYRAAADLPGLRYLLQQQSELRPPVGGIRRVDLQHHGPAQSHRRRPLRENVLRPHALCRRHRELRSRTISSGCLPGERVHAETRPVVPNGYGQFVLRHVCEGLPSGRRQSAAAGRLPVRRNTECLHSGPDCQTAIRTANLPDTYKSDNTKSFEIGSKNTFANRLRIATSVYYVKWNDIQQNVYVGSCGLQFTDNLGTAVAKGGDIQADLALDGGFSLEASVGYTSARFTKTSKGNLAMAGDAISGEAAINYAPGTNPPWTVAIGPQYSFKAIGTRCLRAPRLGIHQPQSVAGARAGSEFGPIQSELLHPVVDDLRLAARRRHEWQTGSSPPSATICSTRAPPPTTRRCRWMRSTRTSTKRCRPPSSRTISPGGRAP